ncbi:MAG TPA: DUF3775 domain-containing protein [Caulobacteraceae bacterium]|jgi:hypothetical protein
MPDLQPELTLDPETGFFILMKAREYNAKVADTDPDDGSNPSDDQDVDVLETRPDDAVVKEIAGAIASLNVDQRLDLVALAWIGRGDFSFAEWAEARESAREVDHVAGYLLEMPALDDYLGDALAELGYSLDDFLDQNVQAAGADRPGTGL